MSEQLFDLYPFPASDHPHDLNLRVAIERSPHLVTLRYELSDPAAQVALTAPAESPRRKNSLWEDTCLECFIATPGSFAYWEFNFAPSGDWNVYQFETYRQGMREETKIEAMPLQISRTPNALTLSAKIDLRKMYLGNLPIQVGLTAVIKTIHGAVSYWALSHRDTQPDFHLLESFVVET